MMKNKFTPALIYLLPLITAAQINHWESVILPADEWHYLLPTEQPSPTWVNADFAADAWQTGISGFGFGDEDDSTMLPEETLAVYMRKEFEVVNKTEIKALLLDMDFDDGFVAYLNGTEVARELLAGDTPAFDQTSDGLHEALLYQGMKPARYEVDIALLVEGTNLLAVQVHNESLTSTDLSAIPVLSVGIATSSTLYRPTPAWFTAPSDLVKFTSSNLPIVVIETEGARPITDEPKVDATMRIISRKSGDRNYLADLELTEHLDYSGNIKIEIRGSSSQVLPKKQYGFTTYADRSEKANVSLLGMPDENDWILNGLAFDASLIRDYLTYNLSRRIGQYATRTEYCEVVLNGEYQGLFILQEKIKDDANRVDINEIGVEDNELPALSGGYITKADKINGDPVAWSMPNYGGWVTDFIHVTPKPEEATAAQTNYIKAEFERLAAAAATGNTSLVDGFPSIIDIPSFIDFMLINELSSNADAYQYSTYFHKDRNGKLLAGPIWDLNLTYGNDLFFWGFDRSHTDIWQFDDGENMGAMFWKDLFDNQQFRCLLARRWHQLTRPGAPLHQESIYAYIEQIVDEIGEAAKREEARWQTVENHEEEINAIKDWLEERIPWMTSQMGGYSSCANVEVPSLVITKIHYHPLATGEFSGGDQEFLEITNTGSSRVDLTGIYIGGSGLVYQFPPETGLRAGGRLILANEADVFEEVYGFTPFDEFSRSINNGGQTITLLDGFGNVIDEVAYQDEEPWPLDAAGNGSYLEVIDPTADNNDFSNWKATPSDELEIVLGSEGPLPVLSIYPNPSEGHVRVVAAGIIHRLVVYDSRGSMVLTIRPNTANYNLDMQMVPAGSYLVTIESSKGKFTRRVVKE